MKRENAIKQSVGIDCGKIELVCSIGVMNHEFEEEIISNKSFKNTPEGFKKLKEWAKKLSDNSVDIIYVIEATGVYHERVSLYLYNEGCKICVMLPNKVKAFSQTLSIKTVNDKTSAQAIAYMGLEKKLDLWQPPHEVFNKLKQLTREREQLIEERTICKNQLHAEESGAWPNKGSLKRIKQRIWLLDKQVNEVETEIKEIVCMNQWLQEKMEYVCSIKGVALITAVTIVAETNGFNLIRNKKQLVSYAGLDVISKESGISVKGKSKISRKGNKYLRKALHFPALVAVRHNEQMKALYCRLVSKHGIKMKAAVAVQKKILELAYVLWKKEEMFDLEYFKNKGQQTSVATLCELT